MDLWATKLRGYREDTDKKPSRISSSKGFPKQKAKSPSHKNQAAGSGVMNKDLNRCAQLLTHMLDAGSTVSAVATKSAGRRPAVTVNKLRKEKPNGLNTSKSRKVRKGKMPGRSEVGVQCQTKDCQLTEEPQNPGENITLPKEAIVIPETDKYAGIHRTVHIPTVLNEQELDEADDDARDKLNPFKAGSQVPNTGATQPVKETSETIPSRLQEPSGTDALQNPLPPFRPTALPSYPSISGLPVSAHPVQQDLPAQPSTPFNRRLPSSTPNMTPTKMAGTADIRVNCPKGALNSTDEIRTVHPPSPANPGPKLTEGTLEFQPRPLGFKPGGSVVSKEILGTGGGNFSLYSDSRNSEVPTRDTDYVYTARNLYAQTVAQYGTPSVQLPQQVAEPTHVYQTPQSLYRTQPTVGYHGIGSSSVGPQQRSLAVTPSVPNQYTDTRLTTAYDSIKFSPQPVITEQISPRILNPESPKHAEETCEPDQDNIVPTESSDRKKTKVTWTDKGVSSQSNSKRTLHRKKTEKAKKPTKVTRGSRSMDAETQVGPSGEHCEVQCDMSPPDTEVLKEGLQSIQRLARDLKLSTASKGTVKVKRLVRQLEETLKLVMPGTGELNWQTELDLALQPLRSETATLRRKVRLLSQELRQKELQLLKAEKPNPTVEVLHLQMLNQKMEKELEDERLSGEQQQQQLRAAQEEIDNFIREKQQMLEVLGHKDDDHLKSQRDWLSEVHKLRADLDAAKKDGARKDKEKEEMVNEKSMLEVAMQEKDQEIDRLQDLVNNLQESMSRLLEDMQLSHPYPLDTAGRISDGLQRIEDLLDDGRPSSHTEVKPLPEPASSAVPRYSSPVKRSLNFDPLLPGQPTRPDPERQSYGSMKDDYQLESRRPILEHSTKGHSMSDELDTTDYFIPPGSSPFGMKLRRSGPSGFMTNQEPEKPSVQNGHSGGPTVKELLSSFTDRMRASLDLSMTLNERKVEPKVPTLDLDKLDEVSELSSGELSLSHDTTLVEDEDAGVAVGSPTHAKTSDYPVYSPSRSENVSRYSVTDYFRKYPRNPADDDYTKKNNFGDDGATHNAVHMQGSLYRGTVLDTSISTIPGADAVSVGTGSTTSVTSMTSVDDHMFREGLAKLDADIAKIQLTLRKTAA